jgi:hypothetical protein
MSQIDMFLMMLGCRFSLTERIPDDNHRSLGYTKTPHDYDRIKRAELKRQKKGWKKAT